MCIDFDGHHSGGSSFVCKWFLILQKLFVYHRYKYSFEKKKSPSIWFRTPKPVQIRQSGQAWNQGVTKVKKKKEKKNLL